MVNDGKLDSPAVAVDVTVQNRVPTAVASAPSYGWGTVPIDSLSYVDLRGDGQRAIAFGTTYGMYLTR